MKVKKQVIIRTVVLFVLLINQFLLILGMNPIPYSEDEIFSGVSSVATVFVTLWAWWKNNSFTKEAQEADVYLESRKKQVKKHKK